MVSTMQAASKPPNIVIDIQPRLHIERFLGPSKTHKQLEREYTTARFREFCAEMQFPFHQRATVHCMFMTRLHNTPVCGMPPRHHSWWGRPQTRTMSQSCRPHYLRTLLELSPSPQGLEGGTCTWPGLSYLSRSVQRLVLAAMLGMTWCQPLHWHRPQPVSVRN